ncbi:TPA: recombinase family protein [Escherichia coli]|nr:recombinase family protein [Escherichia coli]
MQKFVSYIRVSTQKQGNSGLGLEAQRNAISNHVNGKGEIVKEFEEIESGKKGFEGRPQLQLAIDYCKKHKFALVIGKLDRLARDVRFFLEVIDTSKIQICFADLPEVNPNTAEGRMILTSMATFAEFEARKISERTKSALAVVKSRGVKLGTKGSENIAKMNQTRVNQAQVFAEKMRPTITALHAQGLSLRKIANALNESGSTTAKGSQWTAVQVTSILKYLNLKK